MVLWCEPRDTLRVTDGTVRYACNSERFGTRLWQCASPAAAPITRKKLCPGLSIPGLIHLPATSKLRIPAPDSCELRGVSPRQGNSQRCPEVLEAVKIENAHRAVASLRVLYPDVDGRVGCENFCHQGVVPAEARSAAVRAPDAPAIARASRDRGDLLGTHRPQPSHLLSLSLSHSLSLSLSCLHAARSS